MAIDGVVGPPGVGAEAGVDADGVEPDACADCGAAFADFPLPSACPMFCWSPPGAGCEGPGMVPITPKEVDGPAVGIAIPLGASE